MLSWCPRGSRQRALETNRESPLDRRSRHTSRLTTRTAPADSATRSEDRGDLGSATAAKSLDLREMGLPYLLPALAARRCLFSCAALWDHVSRYSSPMFTPLFFPLFSHDKLTPSQKNARGRRTASWQISRGCWAETAEGARSTASYVDFKRYLLPVQNLGCFSCCLGLLMAIIWPPGGRGWKWPDDGQLAGHIPQPKTQEGRWGAKVCGGREK